MLRKALANGNEMTSPTTAEVMAEHSVWPQDPGFKMEAWDGIRANIAMVDAGGACAMIHPYRKSVPGWGRGVRP